MGGLRFDASGVLLGHGFKYERERGNHPIIPGDESRVDRNYFKKSMNYKLDKYSGYLRNNPGETLLMDFEICYGDKYDHEETERWVQDTANLASRYNLGNQMLFANHRDLVGDKDYIPGEMHNELIGDPTGRYWRTPDGGYVALDELWI